MIVHVTLHFDKGFLSEPYWPAREKVITIRKQSGVDRARSEEKRKQALTQYLIGQGLTMDDYAALEAEATRPFRTAADGHIIISAHNLHGMMAHAAGEAPASARLAKKEQIRVVAEWSDLVTDKVKEDGIFPRFIRNPITNQRRFQESPYITDFSAAGTLRVSDPDLLKKARLFVEYAGQNIGVGAGRKLAWGRFTVTRWEVGP